MADEPIRPRFRVPRAAWGEQPLVIPAPEARHVLVRRLGPGDCVVLFDGEGASVVAELVEVGPGRTTARVLGEESAHRESQLRVRLVQAIPVKLPRMEAIIRQTTELGVDAVLPVISSRSQLPGGGAGVLLRKADRWRRIAAEAAKQCGRSRIPEVPDPVLWRDLKWESLPEPRLLADPAAPAGSLRGILEGPAPNELTVLVGGEGGWSPEELEGAGARGCVPVTLGPRVLRADSAGVALIAALQSRWGDLG